VPDTVYNGSGIGRQRILDRVLVSSGFGKSTEATARGLTGFGDLVLLDKLAAVTGPATLRAGHITWTRANVPSARNDRVKPVIRRANHTLPGTAPPDTTRAEQAARQPLSA
jgi:hypothetical protein